MEDFERKLSETDAYLQLLIDQNNSLQQKVNKLPSFRETDAYLQLLIDQNNTLRQKVNNLLSCRRLMPICSY